MHDAVGSVLVTKGYERRAVLNFDVSKQVVLICILYEGGANCASDYSKTGLFPPASLVRDGRAIYKGHTLATIRKLVVSI
jgi:hypothetical protein